MWHEILFCYLWLCFGMAIGNVLIFGYEDIFKGPDRKFGYAYKSPFTYIILVLTSMPFLNIIVCGWVLYENARRRWTSYKNGKSI